MTIIDAGTVLDGKRLLVVDSPLSTICMTDATPFGKSFVAVFLLDEVKWIPTELSAAVRRLLEAGANSFYFHGNGHEEAESLADAVVVERFGDSETTANVVLTASSEEGLGEFLDGAATWLFPAASYVDVWQTDVFFCIAGAKQATMVAELLR